MASGLSRWLSAAELAGRLGWRCERQAEKVLREVRGCLSPGQGQTLRDEAAQEGGQGQDTVFPALMVSPTEGEEEQGEDEERGDTPSHPELLAKSAPLSPITAIAPVL
ncbi:UNVERIFIED_CONTAM: hypothetical protein FKN15_006925 [Acipenser sinensis]